MWRRALCLCLVAGALALERYPPRDLVDFYLASQPHLQDDVEGTWRGKRVGPSLSIVEPIDVLRNRLMLQRQMSNKKQAEYQQLANRLLLDNIGKRQASVRPVKTGESLDYYKKLSEPDWDSS